MRLSEAIRVTPLKIHLPQRSHLHRLPCWTMLALLLCGAPSAHAYIGPGLGAGMVGAILGVVLALLMLVVGIVWYPLKRMIRRLRAKNQAEE